MIRPTNSRDLKTIMEIWLNTMIESHPFLQPTIFLDQYETFMRAHMLEHKSFVYELDGKIIGFISVNEQMMISALSVTTSHQQKGFGEKLLDYAIEKYNVLHAQIYRDNTNALNFLLDNGFQVITNIEDTAATQVLLTYDSLENQKS